MWRSKREINRALDLLICSVPSEFDHTTPHLAVTSPAGRDFSKKGDAHLAGQDACAPVVHSMSRVVAWLRLRSRLAPESGRVAPENSLGKEAESRGPLRLSSDLVLIWRSLVA